MKNLDEVKAAINIFNGLYIGVQLPESAERQFNAGEPWTREWFSPIKGGHCIVLVGYDENYFYAITWGGIVKIDYRWMAKYPDEGYAIVSYDYLDNGKTSEGIDLATLTADLSELAA
jgi:hypothetical protein